VIVALVSPYADDRMQAKSLFPGGDFAEVWVNTPKEICAERDPKGLYRKAAEGQLPNLTGVGQEYERPQTKALELDGLAPLEKNVETLVNTYFA
jgi:bifunctional enzyme CysN/CysC